MLDEKIKNLKLKAKNSGISFFIFISSLFKPKQKSENFKNIEFSSSTQKIGISFTDKIRDIFRFKWIQKENKK
jgi:hypothetical protein